ncbi:hypothetical protein D3OALGA1CA_4650 [Olavius algarvensis associated proteobacterium Delta 3]|nr:hypothetical protein D3OALGA1CA_4650 [Olavius algarvensis associated proteobacterium Delta 3]
MRIGHPNDFGDGNNYLIFKYIYCKIPPQSDQLWKYGV